VNRHLYMAFLSCMGLGVVFMNLPPVLPSLKAAYNVTNASIAFLVTSLVLAHAAVQIPAGLMTDQIGPKKTLIISLGIIFLSKFACVFNTSYTFVMVMRFLGGIGTGFAFNSGLKYASIFTAENRRGMMQGIFGGSFSIGGIIPFFLMPLLAVISWKYIYLASSAFFVLPITCLFLWGKEVKSESVIKLSQFKPVFKSRSIWILGLMHAIFFGGVLTLGTWFSAFVIFTNPSSSLHIAGAWGALMMLISGIARFMGGTYLHWLSARSIVLLSFLSLCACYLLLSQANRFGYVLALFYLAVYLSSLTFGPIFFLSTISTKMELAGSGFGIVNFITNLGSLVLPILFGYFVDLTGTYKISFLFMGMLAIGGSLLTIPLKSSRS
jgi:nitrate/nitrite transporter NarK